MNSRSAFLCCTALAAIKPAFADAPRIFIPNNTVVPVTFQDDLNLKENRRGDRFWTTVRNERDFPRGTKIEGRIVDIQPKRDDKPAFMDLEFTRVIFPDGKKASVRAVPIKMDLNNLTRTSDGRYVATKKVVRKDQYVLGGLVGGAILGNLIKKPFEGAFLGTLAGIIAAETSKDQDSDVVIKRGDQMGALFEQDFTADVNSNYGNYSDQNRDGEQRDVRYRDNDAPRISLDNRDLRYVGEDQPYRLGDTVMVPLERTAAETNLTLEKLSDSVIFVESDDAMLRVELDTPNYRLNGRRAAFSRSPISKRGVIYVPIEALTIMRIGQMAVDGTKVDH